MYDPNQNDESCIKMYIMIDADIFQKQTFKSWLWSCLTGKNPDSLGIFLYADLFLVEIFLYYYFSFRKLFTILEVNHFIWLFLLLIRDHPVKILHNLPMSQVLLKITRSSSGKNKGQNRLFLAEVKWQEIQCPTQQNSEVESRNSGFKYESGTRYDALSGPDIWYAQQEWGLPMSKDKCPYQIQVCWLE